MVLRYVLGIDLGTSAIKVQLVNEHGQEIYESSKSYPLIQNQSGYNEQDPEQWVEQTLCAIKEVTEYLKEDAKQIEGMSFSGQMHGLVLLDSNKQVLRNAILWNDTRTTDQCNEIVNSVGEEELLQITKNPALEGFTLPKILWVKEYEPEIYQSASIFMLPKDYLRYRLTGNIHTEYSDAAGTLMLDVEHKQWSREILEVFGISSDFCPSLLSSEDFAGKLLPDVASEVGLKNETKVFAGGADNACGAIGAGILSEGKTMCSIGTSGVILSYEEDPGKDFQGKVHFFNHGEKSSYYTMGVTLGAGYSLSWFKEVFADNEDYESLMNTMEESPVGAKGLLFTPYIAGERTPHSDSQIRGSFTGIDASHTKPDMVRAVIEGITFSLNESVEIFREKGKTIDTIISIGGGAKSKAWLQIQADIFNAKIVTLTNEQGPGKGAAMLAAYGLGWYESIQDCADHFVEESETIEPSSERVQQYQELFSMYKSIYHHTQELHAELAKYR